MNQPSIITRIFEYKNTRVMKVKLTLTIEKEMIAMAKKFAESSGMSVSQLTEDFFKSLTSKKMSNEVSHPIMNLRGSISAHQVEDWQDDYANHLMKKYKA